MTVGFAAAQTAPDSAGTPTAPADSGAKQAPSAGSILPPEKFIDGPVTDVDPVARTVDVGWFLGLFSTTLEVTDDTQIAVEGGAKGSLDMIREGDRVQASYEAKDGKNVAKAIAVARPERTGMSNRSAGQTPSSAMESPQRPPEPTSGSSSKMQ